MKRFYCECGAEIFFENCRCTVCNRELGFISEAQILISVENQTHYIRCQNYTVLNCNWLISLHDNNHQCRACRLTRTIPYLGIPQNLNRWAKLESTKRRAFYLLLQLHLPIPDRYSDNNEFPLLFDFLEDKRTNPDVGIDFLYTGHSEGIITINVAEADDTHRCAEQALMNEAYRTLLGHFRHELGHYYWLKLIKPNARLLKAFRELFGNEEIDYELALKKFYHQNEIMNWQENYISAYASSHPLEDWAECWAHYFHIQETLETARAYALINTNLDLTDFNTLIAVWMQFSIVLNALNRSMGTSDPYPFVINKQVQDKLHFIDYLVKDVNHLY